MAQFTETPAAAAAMPMEEDENKAPVDAAKDAKDGASTPRADGKPNDMTRCVGGDMCAGGSGFAR